MKPALTFLLLLLVGCAAPKQVAKPVSIMPPTPTVKTVKKPTSQDARAASTSIVVPPVIPPLEFPIIMPAGLSYCWLEASDDLVNWISVPFRRDGEAMIIMDAQYRVSPNRFYRVAGKE